MNDDEIRHLLVEDVGLEEADALLPLLSQLRYQDGPVPAAGETEELIAQMQDFLPQQRRERRTSRMASWWPAQMLRAQARVVRGEIWTASTLVMVLGAIVSLILAQDVRVAAQPLVLLSPAVAAAGIAFLYSPADERVRELELVTAVSLRLLLLTRLLLVFAFNLMLGIGSSLLLAAALPEVTWWALVTLWLAPMTFLSALAFLLTVFSNMPDLAMLVSLGIWMLQIVRSAGNMGQWLAWLPDLMAAAAQPWLLAMAMLLFSAALWAGGRDEQWL